jgi:ferric-dicitrate binding protein FerR (iron transport regulator)
MSTPNQQMWKLIQRYISGDCTSDEYRIVEQWMDEDPANQNLVKDLTKIWEGAPAEDFHVNTEDAWKKFHKQHMRQPGSDSKQYYSSHRNNWKTVITRAAAVILVVALAGFFSWQYISNGKQQEEKPVIAMQKLTTKKGEKKQITFSDGTTITLNVASTLRFPKNFKGTDREVYLSGEAYFNVAHEKNRPFIVHTPETAIKVLGTQFDVRAWKEDEKTSVGVRSGKVALFSSDSLNKEPSHIFLTNGQAASVRSGHISSKRNINVANMALWKSGGMYFKNTPFSKVVKRIEQRFDVQIKIENPGLEDVPFTSTFKHVGLKEILNVITASMGIQYAVKDSAIVFK